MTHPRHRYIHGTRADEQHRLTRLNDLLNEASLGSLRIQRGEKILDVGSGLGQLTRAIARAAGPDGTVVGVEANAQQIGEALRQARGVGEERIVDFREGDAVDLPLRSKEWGTFDVAHARFVLEHVRDPQAVVDAMVRAVRPGGRIVLEDDDHDVLRLWPEVPGLDRVWAAYIESFKKLQCDPHVGRRLVSLLRRAGTVPSHNAWPFFGGCAGTPVFTDLVENFVGLLDGARETMVETTGLEETALNETIESFRRWGRLPDAAMWYATFWAEGAKPLARGQMGERTTRVDPGPKT